MRIATLLGLFFLAVQAHAGTVLEMSHRDLEAQRPESKTSTYAQGGMMRIEMPAHGSVLIFKNDTLYTLDTKRKTYSAMDRATIQQLAARINPALAQMQEQLSRLPPEQRAKMEAAMGGGAPRAAPTSPPEMRKTSRTEKVGGRTCSYTEIREGGTLSAEVCVVPASTLDGADELMKSAARMSALMEEMVAALKLPGMQQAPGSRPEDYSKLGGIPLISRSFSGGKPVLESRLASMRTEALSADLFAIPTGYTKVDMGVAP